MPQLQRFRFSVEVDAVDYRSAVRDVTARGFIGPNFPANAVKNLGYVHPENRLLDCAPTPEGFYLVVCPRSEDLGNLYLAVPKGEQYNSGHVRWGTPYPQGTLVWMGGADGWVIPSQPR